MNILHSEILYTSVNSLVEIKVEDMADSFIFLGLIDSIKEYFNKTYAKSEYNLEDNETLTQYLEILEEMNELF